MSVRYLPIDGEHVSAEWLTVLREMRKDGVVFNVNEGHRTRARQQELIDEKGLWSPSNPTGAAPVSGTAPHIRDGRIDHAIDFSNDGAVFAWLSAHGLRPARTVPLGREPWHIEVPAAELIAFHRKHNRPSAIRFLGKVRRKAAATLLARRRARIAEGRSGKGPRWERADRLVRRSARKVQALAKRAHGRQARILRRVLKDRDGDV